MPLASGSTGTDAYTAEDVALTKAYKDNATQTGSNSSSYTASKRTIQLSFENSAPPATGAQVSYYDPELAALLAGELAV